MQSKGTALSSKRKHAFGNFGLADTAKSLLDDMSGEAVVLIGAIPGVGGVAIAGGAAYLAARMLLKWMDEQHAIAEREMRRQKEETATWLEFHRSEQDHIERLTREREQARKTLEGMRLAESRGEASCTVENRGFVVDEGEAMSALLGSLLAMLPPDLNPAVIVPLQRLEEQARDLDRRPRLSDETRRAFRATLQETAARILEQQEQETAARGRLLERVEAVLERAIAGRRLATDPGLTEQFAELQDHLLRLLTTGEVHAAGVELLEEQSADLISRVERDLEKAGIAAVLRERVQHHLQALGYRRHSDSGEPDVWQIPGGEQVRVALQPGNRLAFQLVHERTLPSELPLSATELDFVRAQELRWCTDLHGMLRRLQEDGFEFQIQMERETPQQSIPVVVVEDVDEWSDEGEIHEAPQRKRLT